MQRKKIYVALAATIMLGACGGPDGNKTPQEADTVLENILQDKSEYSTGKNFAPTATQPAAVRPQTNTVNIYVENSGSMYGYVGTGMGSDFRTTVYNYLSDIKLSGLFRTMNLFFVNSNVIPQGSAVDDFVNKLQPNSFKVSGGNGGATDIVEIIKRVYPKAGSVAVLVSDCIVSPGRGKNAAEYLDNQQIGIKGFLGQRGDIANEGMIIYRMAGDFEGRYYDPEDRPCRYKGKRPYYIWVMGDAAALKAMREQLEKKMKTRIEGICVISMGEDKPRYNIVAAGGRYQLSHQDPQHTIQKLKKKKTAEGERAVIKLSADYSQLLQDEAYLTNTKNYEVSDTLYRVDKVSKGTDGRYIVSLSCPIVRLGTISVRLKNRMPEWVERCSTTDGSCPDPKAALQTTYGLSYLLGGAYDAFTFNGDNLFEMKITIKK